AIDDDRGPLHGIVSLVHRLVTELFKFTPRLGVDDQLRAPSHQALYLRSLILERRALVKGHLIDAKRVFEVGEEPDEGLSNRPRTDDVDKFLAGHRSSSPRRITPRASRATRLECERAPSAKRPRTPRVRCIPR